MDELNDLTKELLASIKKFDSLEHGDIMMCIGAVVSIYIHENGGDQFKCIIIDDLANFIRNTQVQVISTVN